MEFWRFSADPADARIGVISRNYDEVGHSSKAARFQRRIQSLGCAMMDTDKPRCIDCGAESPQTNTNYTLISQQHGWRLAIEADISGRRVATWRCPKCWAQHRDKKRQSR
jgi:hypothetical protein